MTALTVDRGTSQLAADTEPDRAARTTQACDDARPGPGRGMTALAKTDERPKPDELIAERVRRVLADRALSIVHQPIVNLADRQPVGYEDGHVRESLRVSDSA
jgi:hypothetical protein